MLGRATSPAQEIAMSAIRCCPYLRPLAALALGALAATATADEQRTTAMLWGSALEGTVQVGPGTADFDLSLEDILNVLDGSLSLRHDARGADRGWYAEYIFNDLKREASGALGERQANMEQEILELGVSRPIGEGWEVYGGARWEAVDMSIDFALLPTATDRMDWVDALLGVRWSRESAGSRYWARGDVAGGGSDGAFLLEAGGAWGFGDDWEFTLAYRMLDTEVGDGAMLIDLSQTGMVIGISKGW
jgi:hypothetical protein